MLDIFEANRRQENIKRFNNSAVFYNIRKMRKRPNIVLSLSVKAINMANMKYPGKIKILTDGKRFVLKESDTGYSMWKHNQRIILRFVVPDDLEAIKKSIYIEFNAARISPGCIEFNIESEK